MAQIGRKLPSEAKPRGEAEDGKLRFGSFFVYGRGSYKIFLWLWRENTSLPDEKRPGNTYLRAAVQKQ